MAKLNIARLAFIGYLSKITSHSIKKFVFIFLSLTGVVIVCPTMFQHALILLSCVSLMQGLVFTRLENSLLQKYKFERTPKLSAEANKIAATLPK